MKSSEKKSTKQSETGTLLQLTKQLLANYQPVAVKQNSFFINDVPSHLPLYADRQILETLLGSLFYLTARCGRDTCIKVTAKAYHDVLLLHIVDTSTFNSYAILSQLQHLQILAEKIGGFLDITSRRNKFTTISFSFMNRKDNYLTIGKRSENEIERNDEDFIKYLRAS